MFISDFLDLNEEQCEVMFTQGVFDAVIDKDSNFFINIIRLKESIIPEFIEAYEHINRFFSDIATLLDSAEKPSMKDPMYKAARKRFHFHEVNGINLGFSKSRHGAGWGNELSDKFLLDAYQIVKKGSKQPEIFHLVSLFEEDVAADRLSDMIATIIEPEIKKYSLRIMHDLSITPRKYPNLTFNSEGLIKNPYKNAPILFLPVEILHELPIAEDWDDIGRVASENNYIRQEISKEIGAAWITWSSADRKMYLKENIFLNPNACSRVIEGYRKKELSAYDLREDLNYFVEMLLREIKKTGMLNRKIDDSSSQKATKDIILIFKDWVENNRGWYEIQNASRRQREKSVQKFMQLGAKYYVENNNLDFSLEANEGRGPLDIKISRGTDKTIAEIKLSSNTQYLHGYEKQILEYGKAERTNNFIYVFVDLGNPFKKNKLVKLYKKAKRSGNPYPELVIIDSQPKNAASTYN